jgi:pyruvate,orthophosphate dikinase
MGLLIKGSDPTTVAEKQRMLQAVDNMREKNPMLGLRGCRLGLIYKGIYKMQVKAIVGAACDAVKQGVTVNLGASCKKRCRGGFFNPGRK